MQNLTFTQRLFRQRNFLSALLPLLTLLVGLGSSYKAVAQTFNSDNITITSSPTGATASPVTYDGLPDDNNSNPNYFQSKDLGNGASFSLTTGSLIVNAAAIDFNTLSTRPATSASLLYRVYQTGSAVQNIPNYSVLALPLTSGANNAPSVVFNNTNAAINLLTQPQVLGGGNYTVDIQFVVAYTRGTSNLTISDPSNPSGFGYTATFSVIAPPITPPGGTSTWISTTGNGGSTNWTLPSNWSNGVPTRFSDAIIPGKDVAPTGVAPVLNDPNIAYEVRTLTLQNSSNANRATLTINTATLRVYGDLNQPGGGVTSNSILNAGVPDPTQNSTIVFAGGNQVIRGSLVAQDVRIEGTGVKSVVNRMTIYNTLILNPTDVVAGVLLQTAVESSSGGSAPVLTVNFDTSTNSVIDLNGSGKLLGPAGVLPAETNVTFVQGVMRSNRVLRANTTELFGNIGLDITPDKSTAADVTVTRIVGDALSGPTTSSATAVKRQFQVGGEVNATAATQPSDIITSTVVFHYLDSSSGYNELNGNTNESNLVLFRTVNNGVPFIPQGGTPNPGGNTVTRTLMTTINTLTLGDRTNPLPVTVASFDAKRVGADAVVMWQTASEQNNKGFNVQVSTNGTEYRTLGFVASSAPNTTIAQNYSFTDTEKNKSGVRYYRLQQVDFDGKSAYFAPRTVSFEKGALATETSLSSYPNPFTSSVHLMLNAGIEGQGQVRITDMAGRAMGQRTIMLANGSNDVELNDLSNLKSGIYLMHITLPGGVSKNLRVVKQ
jgi:hypothetical protein